MSVRLLIHASPLDCRRELCFDIEYVDIPSTTGPNFVAFLRSVSDFTDINRPILRKNIPVVGKVSKARDRATCSYIFF